MSGNYDHGGGVRRLMEKTILNFHFDCLTPSLRWNMVVPNFDKFQVCVTSCSAFSDRLLKKAALALNRQLETRDIL